MAKRWTVLQAKRSRQENKWWAYPPGFVVGPVATANRRFATWQEAIDYVRDQQAKVRGIAS